MSKGFVLYHRTSECAAAAILRDGFVDSEGSYMTDGTLNGVFLSNRPLSGNEGAGPLGDGVVLEIQFSIPLDDLADYELVDDRGTYREWCLPAAKVAQCATIKRAEIDDALEEPAPSWEARLAGLRAVRSVA